MKDYPEERSSGFWKSYAFGPAWECSTVPCQGASVWTSANQRNRLFARHHTNWCWSPPNPKARSICTLELEIRWLLIGHAHHRRTLGYRQWSWYDCGRMTIPKLWIKSSNSCWTSILDILIGMKGFRKILNFGIKGKSSSSYVAPAASLAHTRPATSECDFTEGEMFPQSYKNQISS